MGLLEKLASVGRFIPGSEVAKGLSLGFGLKDIKKREEESTRRRIDQDTQLIKLLKEARNRGDTRRVSTLTNLLKSSRTPGIMSEALSEAPSTKQIVASGAELALLASLGLKPGLKGVVNPLSKGTRAAVKGLKMSKAAARAKKIASAGKIGGAAIKFGVPVAREAAIGAGFSGLAKQAFDKDATVGDTLREARTGALFGGVFTAGTIAGVAGLSKIGSTIGSKFSSKGGGLIARLERTAAGQGLSIGGKTQVDRTLALIGESPQTIKSRAAQKTLTVLESSQKVKSGLLDRFSALERIENKLIEFKGSPLGESEKIYRDARLLSSVADARAEVKINEFFGKLADYKDIRDPSRAYITQLDLLDRAALGQKVAGGQSVEDLTVGLARMVKEIGPKEMERVEEVRKIVSDYNVRALRDRVDAGLITQQTMNKLTSTHPNYIPHNVILDVDDKAINAMADSFNVAKTDIRRAMGSVKNIRDPFEAMTQRTPITTKIIEKNKLLNNMARVAEENPDVIPGMRKLTTGTKPDKNFGTINFFRNGEAERWQVPLDVEVAIKNLDTPLTPSWFRLATLPSRILKKGATQFNLSFSIPNLFRDKQTAALTSSAFIEDLAKKYGTTAKAMDLSKDEVLALYKQSGGFGASIFKDGEEQILKNLEKTGIAKNLQYTNPLRLTEKINEQIEQSTRLAVFRKGLTSGLSPKDAALASRDATIDFAKMGQWMRPLNQAIPFLNARVQGFANLPKALKASPEAFARMQLYTAVYPTMLLHEHNRRFDSHSNISQFIKDKYWVIMTGEVEGIDPYTGNPVLIPQFVTLPRGEGQALVAAPIQWALEKADGIDFRKGSEVLADTLGSASPLEFQSFGQGNAWLSLASQLGPVGTIPFGLGANVDPFSGSPIVPPDASGSFGGIPASPKLQFSRGTSEIAKTLGNQFNYSPAKIEFILDSFGAGLSKDVQDTLDIAYGVVRDGKIGNKSISQTPAGYATQLPVTRRFFRESTEFGSPEFEKRTEQKEDITQPIVDRNLILKREAEEIVTRLNQIKSSESRLNYLNSLGDSLTPDLRKKVSELKKRRATIEVLRTSDRVEVRAKYILDRLAEMKEVGEPQEVREQFLSDLDDAKILTKRVRKAMVTIRDSN